MSFLPNKVFNSVKQNICKVTLSFKSEEKPKINMEFIISPICFLRP